MKPFVLLISPPRRALSSGEAGPPRASGGKDLTYENIVPPEYPPLNLAYLAAYLEQHNYEVEIIDCDIEKNPPKKINHLIQERKPLLAGLTATTPLFGNAKTLAQFIKKQNPTLPIVLGGTHATVAAQLVAPEPMFDFLVIGEGEQTILELAESLKNHQMNFRAINGLVFKQSGQIIFNPPRRQIDNLDELPLPDRTLFKNHAYQYPDVLATPVFPIITSRGCSGICTYCASRQIFPHVKFRSAANVVAEIEDLIKNHGAREIHIWDDCFTLSKKRVLEIRDLLKEKKFKVKFAFPNGLRADQVDEEVLRTLKEMGTYSVAFGVESGSQRILDGIKKNLTLDQIKKAFNEAKKIKLETWGFFMLGLPEETAEDIKKTINFAKWLNPDIVKFNILVPFPGTEAYQYLLDNNLLIEKDFAKYGYHSRPVHRLPTLSPDDLILWQKIAYRRFYLRPKKLFQQILRLKSLTRLKINLKTGWMVFRLMFKKD